MHQHVLYNVLYNVVNASSVSELLCQNQGILYRYISVRQPSAKISSALFKCVYTTLPPRTIEEWTYLLTNAVLLQWSNHSH